jgi:hypothetical protein
MNSVQWEQSSMRTDGGRTDGGRTDRQTDRRTDKQTDMMKLIVAFRNFANAPKNQSGNVQ